MVAFIGNWKCSNEGMDMMYNFKDKVELVITTFMGEMTTKYELLPAENKHERMDISFPISSPDPTSTQPQMMTLHCYYKYDKDQDVLTLWCPKQSENMSEQKPIEECDELVCHRHVHKLPPEVEKMTEDERLLKAVEEIRNFVVKRIAAVAVLHPGSEEEVMNYAMGDVKGE